MNDLERTLQAVLQIEAARTSAPSGLIGRAQRQAVHMRRRRTATRASLGVATAVAGGVAITTTGFEVRRDRVDITATASAAASPSATRAAATAGVRVIRTSACTLGPLPTTAPRPGMTCTSTTIEIARAGETVRRLAMSERVGPGEHTAGDPVSLLVEYMDDTSQTVAARRESDGVWIFDVDLRPDEEIRRMAITDSGGGRMEWIRDGG